MKKKSNIIEECDECLDRLISDKGEVMSHLSAIIRGEEWLSGSFIDGLNVYINEKTMIDQYSGIVFYEEGEEEDSAFYVEKGKVMYYTIFIDDEYEETIEYEKLYQCLDALCEVYLKYYPEREEVIDEILILLRKIYLNQYDTNYEKKERNLVKKTKEDVINEVYKCMEEKELCDEDIIKIFTEKIVEDVFGGINLSYVFEDFISHIEIQGNSWKIYFHNNFGADDERCFEAGKIMIYFENEKRVVYVNYDKIYKYLDVAIDIYLKYYPSRKREMEDIVNDINREYGTSI